MDAHGRAADQEVGFVGSPEVCCEGLSLGDGAAGGMEGVEAVEFGQVELGRGLKPRGQRVVQALSALVAWNVKGGGRRGDVPEQGVEERGRLVGVQNWISPSTMVKVLPK